MNESECDMGSVNNLLANSETNSLSNVNMHTLDSDTASNNSKINNDNKNDNKDNNNDEQRLGKL